MRKTQILIINPSYLGLSNSDLSKTVVYKFQYEYVKPKYDKNAKKCYMDTDSFIVHAKTEYIYKILEKMLKEVLTLQILN